MAHQLAITTPKDAKRKLLKHNNNNQSLEDFMKALLTAAFFSELLIVGCAVASISPIESENNLYNRII